MKNDKILFHVSSRALEEKISGLKQAGLVPANVYGLQKNSEIIAVNARAMQQHLKTEGETGLLYLVAGEKGAEQPVLISEVQRHPVTDDLIHISFKRVNLAEKITQDIAVKLVGEFEVKEATVLLVRDTLEVEALPADLPEAFYIDISKLTEVGQEVKVADLDYDRSKVTVLLTEEEQAEPIALVQAVEEEKEEEPAPEAEVAEGEAGAAAGEGAEGAAETPAEGATDKSEEKSE